MQVTPILERSSFVKQIQVWRRFVRPHFEARRRLKVEELDPLEASMLLDPQLCPEDADENAEEENKTEDEPVDAQVQTDFSPMVEHRGPEPHVLHETVELPGSPPGTPEDLPDLPRVGLDWQNLDVAEEHFPRLQRERAQRVREVALFSEQNLREFYMCHLMVLYPNQPDMSWDHPLWWDRRQQHEYRVFQKHCH